MQDITHKSHIEKFLNVSLSCNFEENLFKDICEALTFMKYYRKYNKLSGFFEEFEELGPQRHLY